MKRQSRGSSTLLSEESLARLNALNEKGLADSGGGIEEKEKFVRANDAGADQAPRDGAKVSKKLHAYHHRRQQSDRERHEQRHVHAKGGSGGGGKRRSRVVSGPVLEAGEARRREEEDPLIAAEAHKWWRKKKICRFFSLCIPYLFLPVSAPFIAFFSLLTFLSAFCDTWNVGETWW
jgi:hypothetical protein